METLEHGILFLELRSIPYSLIGFYFRPRDGPVKCLLLDPTLDPSKRIVILDHILGSSLYTQIQYRELRRPADANRLKFALINMQSSFDDQDLHQAIRDDLRTMESRSYESIFLNYVIKAVGQNPAERLSQCEGVCYRGPVPNIESYDPFGPKQIYHRDLPAPTLADNNHISDLSRYFARIRSSVESCSLSLLPTTSASEVLIPVDTLFRTFLVQAIDPGTAAGDPHPIPLPLSYRMGPHFNYESSAGMDFETYLQLRWGLHLYHGSCWELALTLLNDSHQSLLDGIRVTRKTTQWGSIIGNNVNSPRGHQYPSAIALDESACSDRTIVYPCDPSGLASTIISNYSSFNSKTGAPERWNQTAIQWTEWRPLLGPNIWFYLLAPSFRNRDHPGYDGLIRTLYHLIDPFVGGFLHEPLNRHNSKWTFWTQDNLVLYAVLNQPRSLINSKFKPMLLSFLGQCLDRENFFFFGRHYWKGSGLQRILDGVYSDERPLVASAKTVRMPPLSNSIWVVSTLDQIWAVCALGPIGLEEIFGVPQAGLRLWAHLRSSCGRFSPGGELQGFGYTNIRSEFDAGMGSVISAEVTFGALIAARCLRNHYGAVANSGDFSLDSDLIQMETYVYSPGNLLGLQNEAAYFKEATIRTETGLGEMVHPIPSILGTAWHLFYHHQLNPLGLSA